MPRADYPVSVAFCALLFVLGAPAFAAGQGTADTPPPKPTVLTVLTGLDVLVEQEFAALAGRKVGLITNHTGVDYRGRSAITLLHDAPNVNLAALFSPEHGIHGKLDTHVQDSVDSGTGLKIYSLYGKTRRPSAEMLAGVDTLVFDIQDIGTRFYTYIATMAFAMEAAAEHGLHFVVLDRPNPITGTRVFGPFNTSDGHFTAYHHMPLVHGMTVGELATMFNEERKIGADLHVVKMKGWQRDMWYDQTGLVWIDPSPNMRSLTQATLYPAVGMIEACRISVGRGTDTPFERFGAPWVDERRLAATLNERGLPGVRFVPFRFTPTASKFKGESCGGVQVLLIDRNAFDPAEAGLWIAHALETLHESDFDHEKVTRLIFNDELVARIPDGPQGRRWKDAWREELARFEKVRALYLMYR